MSFNVRGRSPQRGSRFGGPTSPRFRGASKRKVQSFSDVSKFINKAVVTEEVEVFVPTHKFADFALEPILKKNIEAKGYELPTPIQDKSIPHVLNGEDIVGIANTGTGKTAAFLIPLINKALKDKSQKILIVAPVRELAFQINEELKEFAKGSGFYSAILIGGASMGLQIRELRSRPTFVIGTPGRIKDHIESGYLDLTHFQTVVLDEADRMLDMGFINDMRFLMTKMAKERHTLFFSATLSSDIERLIGEFLKTPVRISVKTRDTSKNIDQDVIRIQGRHKFDVLKELLKQEGFDKTLVFARTKHGADKIAKALLAEGIKADAIHGNKAQNARQRTLEDFKKERLSVLVATDVAARGLDISGISHVINFDLPATYEDYVHRIGRTGRASKKGKALTFID
jgi:ATP-dependent RNA helicase RhlE